MRIFALDIRKITKPVIIQSKVRMVKKTEYKSYKVGTGKRCRSRNIYLYYIWFTSSVYRRFMETYDRLRSWRKMSDPRLQINESVYCIFTFKWVEHTKDDCPHVWKQTKDEDDWGEWTCQKCGGRGRADVWG